MFKSRQCTLKCIKKYKILPIHFQLTSHIHASACITKLRLGLTYAKHVETYPD